MDPKINIICVPRIPSHQEVSESLKKPLIQTRTEPCITSTFASAENKLSSKPANACTFRCSIGVLLVEIKGKVVEHADRFERRGYLKIDKISPVDRLEELLRLQLVKAIRSIACKERTNNSEIGMNQDETETGIVAKYSSFSAFTL